MFQEVSDVMKVSDSLTFKMCDVGPKFSWTDDGGVQCF